MNSLQSIICPGVLVHIHFTLFVCTSEQICLQYCIYMAQFTEATVHYIQTPHYHTYHSKNTKMQFLFTFLLPYMCHQQTCQSNSTFESYYMYIIGGICQYICETKKLEQFSVTSQVQHL